MFAASELNEGLFTNAPRLAGRPPYIEVAQRRSAEASRARGAADVNAHLHETDCFGPWLGPVRPADAIFGIAVARSIGRCDRTGVFCTP